MAQKPSNTMLVEEVRVKELRKDVTSAKITNCKYAASFNWLKRERASIAIPGEPPRWTPSDVPEQLREDDGEYYRDINAAHYPAHPVEPAVRALLVQEPDLTPEDIDVFACGSTIGHLLRLVLGTQKPFKFVVELIGETVFFLRREGSPTELIPDVRGYGHTFPEKYTSWDEDLRDSDSHQRMIRYDFAGFNCIVRYEADGYLSEKAMRRDSAVADILSLPKLEALAISQAGKAIPQQAIFDLKTRAAWKQDDVLLGELGRLWARQIPNFVLAYHRRGLFEDIRVRDIRDDLTAWEQKHQKELRLLASLIGRIIAAVKDVPEKRLEICCQRAGILELRHVGSDVPRALPEDLRRVWTNDASSESDCDDEAEFAKGVWLGGSDDEDSGGEDFTACSPSCDYCVKCKN